MYMIFLALIALQIGSWFYFNDATKKANTQFDEKNEVVLELKNLQNQREFALLVTRIYIKTHLSPISL